MIKSLEACSMVSLDCRLELNKYISILFNLQLSVALAVSACWGIAPPPDLNTRKTTNIVQLFIPLIVYSDIPIERWQLLYLCPPSGNRGCNSSWSINVSSSTIVRSEFHTFLRGCPVIIGDFFLKEQPFVKKKIESCFLNYGHSRTVGPSGVVGDAGGSNVALFQKNSPRNCFRDNLVSVDRRLFSLQMLKTVIYLL